MRLVLCDDHALLLEALRCALEESGHTVLATSEDPVSCVEAVRAWRPDVCLIDVSFPGADGLQAVPQLLQASPSTRVLVLSGNPGPEVVRDALAAGAVGFLRKDQPVEGIVAALQGVQEGRARVGEVSARVTPRARVPQVGDPRWLLRFLTDREREVLQRILEGESTEAMAESMGVARSTARTHVQNVLQKLGVHSRLQAAARVVDAGLDEVERPA